MVSFLLISLSSLHPAHRHAVQLRSWREKQTVTQGSTIPTAETCGVWCLEEAVIYSVLPGSHGGGKRRFFKERDISEGLGWNFLGGNATAGPRRTKARVSKFLVCRGNVDGAAEARSTAEEPAGQGKEGGGQRERLGPGCRPPGRLDTRKASGWVLKALLILSRKVTSDLIFH